MRCVGSILKCNPWRGARSVHFLPDGRNLNQELVRAGLAWWYRQYAKRDQVLAALEQEARAAKRGLWVEASPVPPWEWRKSGAAR
jgi:micrococcal nuclease